MTDEELIKKYIPEKEQEKAFKKLKKGYPVQYIIGNVNFYGYDIIVNKHVLIPRFETEYLVEKTIKYLKQLNVINPKVLEIGTGSGCISIALKKNVECEIDAIDISKSCINVANKNAQNNNVKVNFIKMDINKLKLEKKYDLIISNPPYVKYDKMVHKRLRYEPKKAIFAKEDGIFFYKVILEKIKNNLSNNFLIAFEIDDKEGNEVVKLAKRYLGNVCCYIEKDYNNLERYVFISKFE